MLELPSPLWDPVRSSIVTQAIHLPLIRLLTHLLPVYAGAANTNALTITDAASVTLVGYAAGGAFGNTVLDAVRHNCSVSSIHRRRCRRRNRCDHWYRPAGYLDSLYRWYRGDLTIGDMADGDSLTTVTVSASAGDVAVGELGGTGGAASGTAEALATITATAAKALGLLLTRSSLTQRIALLITP